MKFFESAKRLLCILSALWLIAASVSLFADAPKESPADASTYTIKPGDILDFRVWKEPDLSREVLVAPDGFISISLIGAINTSGKTITMLSNEVEKKLAAFINQPSVHFGIRAIAGNKVYVIGKVARPGDMILGEPLDVLQALSRAGGLTPFADAGDIKIIRRKGSEQQVSEFNFNQVERGKHLEQNILLQNGDIVIVP